MTYKAESESFFGALGSLIEQFLRVDKGGINRMESEGQGPNGELWKVVVTIKPPPKVKAKK